MTPGRRILIGAALCALAVLLVHPRSRGLYTVYVHGYGFSPELSRSVLLARNLNVLPVPVSELDGAIWMQVGVEKELRRRSLKQADLKSLCVVADHFARKDPDNAFWLQMGAVFYGISGNDSTADERWRRAAACARWEDYQTDRLNQLASVLQREFGAEMAWQKAYAIHQRSAAAARAIEIYGRSRLTKADLETPMGLDLRFTALRNGVLLRDGAGSLEGGRHGIRLVECSALPILVLEQYSPHALQLARMQLANNLDALGRREDAAFAREAFQKNEAWLAITSLHDPNVDRTEYAVGSVAAAVLPGASLICAAIGALLALSGYFFRIKKKLHPVLQPPYAQAIGVGIALAAYAITSMALLSLTLALCFAFASYQPERSRSKPPSYLGPFFRFTLIVLATVFFLLAAAFVSGLTTPAIEVFTAMEAPSEYFNGQTLPLALSALVLSLVLLVGPSWAMVLRIPTPEVLGRALQELGVAVLYLGLVGAIALAPAALALDARFGSRLDRLLDSEPAYYLRR